MLILDKLVMFENYFEFSKSPQMYYLKRLITFYNRIYNNITSNVRKKFELSKNERKSL